MNEEKAAILYAEIDRNPLFKGFAEVEDRSLMNVTFNMTDETHKDVFDKMWNEAGISGIKGHRSVGGYRASIYNAMPKSSVQALVDVMQAFEKQVS
jgi:phosphoserine aminotransferase